MSNKYSSIIEKLKGRYSDDLLIGPSVDEAHLNAVEARIGHLLPSDYRIFLSKYAGIRFECAEFPLLRDGRNAEASFFLFYGSGENETLADLYHQSIENYGFIESNDGSEYYPGLHLVRDTTDKITKVDWPKELLPIGCDEGGNQICLALFGLRPGAIFFWRNAPFPNKDNLYLIANSFDEFMHLLYRPDEV